VRPVHALRHALARLGYQETINFGFVEEGADAQLSGVTDPIRVLNPIAAPMSVMRTTLLGGLLEVLTHNVARKATRVCVFEVGRAYLRDPSVVDGGHAVAGVAQPLRIAGLAWGSAMPLQWAAADRGVDFYDVKGDVQALFAPREPRFVTAKHPAMHPGRCAAIDIDGRIVGHVGELHPRLRQQREWAHAPMLFEIDAAALIVRDLPVAAPLSRQQSVVRDIALVVRETVAHDALIGCAQRAAGPHLEQATLFDVFVPKSPTSEIGAGERSVAVRLEWRDDEQPLTDERVEALWASVVQSLQSELSARLRG
jgi:phenylalanyl-tRNA synthetase beta chain